MQKNNIWYGIHGMVNMTTTMTTINILSPYCQLIQPDYNNTTMIKDEIKCGFNISEILGNITGHCYSVTKTHLRSVREIEST